MREIVVDPDVAVVGLGAEEERALAKLRGQAPRGAAP